MSFLNKVVVITGAASGIGEATALHFAELSASLSLIDINEKGLVDVAKQCEKLGKGKVITAVADVSEDVELKKAVDQTIKELGRIDVLVNCAGIIADKGILDADLLSVFDKVMKVNLRSMVAMTHYAAPALVESKGCVVNIASAMSKMVCKGMIPYNVSKAAVLHFTKNLSLDLADKGVRVNSISPGPTMTNILVNSGQTQEENDMVLAEYAKMVPLQHNAQPSEVAQMVVYLASDKAKSITGADFAIDCGLTLSGLKGGFNPKDD